MPANDPLGAVWPGDRPPSSARAFNAFREAARANKGRQLGQAPPPGPLEFDANPATLVLVQAGADGLDAWSISTYGTPAVTPEAGAGRGEVGRRPIFAAGAPAAGSDEVCITIEAAAPGGTARAVCAGVAVVRLLVNDEAHTRAAPVVGDTSQMETATSGGYAILWKPSADDGNGERWGLVLLAGGNGSGGGNGGGGGSCTPPGLDPAGCLMFTVAAGAGRCAGIGAATINATLAGGWWVGDDTITTADGAGTISYRIDPATGLEQLKIVTGTTYYGTRAGCDSAGRPVFAFGGAALCGGTANTETCSNGFTIAVGCVPCGIDECTGWYCDSDTGTTYYAEDCAALAALIASLGGGGSPITTACGRVVPPTLYLSFGGILAGLGLIPLTYTGSLWASASVPNTLGCGSNPTWAFTYNPCTHTLYGISPNPGLPANGCIIDTPGNVLGFVSDGPFLDTGTVTVVPGTGCGCDADVTATVYGD